MVSSKVFYTADDVAELLTISRPTAYRIIRKLNDELAEKGFIIISGRVPKKYFDEKFYC
ncbi:MAG: transcriptional regulator [Clostridia bacterium]|nr:transcriptional regulator [Clostridia bacterium]MBQ9850363.1 transcriptional regulator [Clostridia bacterium]